MPPSHPRDRTARLAPAALVTAALLAGCATPALTPALIRSVRPLVSI